MKAFAEAVEDYRARRIAFDELIRVALAYELKMYGFDPDALYLPVDLWMERSYRSLAAIDEDVPEFLWAWFRKDREPQVTLFIEDVDGIGNVCQSVVRISFRNLVKEMYRRTRKGAVSQNT